LTIDRLIFLEWLAMPFMTTARTLRKDPNGDEMSARFSRGFEVTILQESEGWVQVQRGAITGWVLKDVVGDTSPLPPDASVDNAAFFRQCWLEGLKTAVFPHYLAGVAKLRSDIMNDTQSNQIGPFRFLQAEWDAGRKDAALNLIDFGSGDIQDWGFQLAMFAAMATRDFDAVKTVLGRPPSAHELYLTQLIGPKAATAAMAKPADSIQMALASVADTALPIGGLTRDQIMTRYAKYLLDPGLPPVSDRIATDLQTALDAVKDGIIAAGTDVLGVTPDATQLVSDPKQPQPIQPGPVGSLPDTPNGAGPSGRPGAGGPLGQLIARGEGDYGTFNRGNAGDSPRKRIDFSQMTIRDIMALQSLPPGNGRRLFAVGKYQVIPVTMRGAVAALGIGPDEKFGPPLQEKVFRNYLIADKRPKVKNYITGKNNDLFGAQLALALEFASVADPNTGRSHYGGSGGNRASIKTAETAAALNTERATYQASLAAGVAPNNAWNALSG
jgi:hypothetical protein